MSLFNKISNDINEAHFDKNTNSCERSAVKIDKLENIQDILVDT